MFCCYVRCATLIVRLGGEALAQYYHDFQEQSGRVEQSNDWLSRLVVMLVIICLLICYDRSKFYLCIYLIYLGYAGCNTALAIFMLLVTSGLNILVTPGCKSNVVDIAPAYSGIYFPVWIQKRLISGG